MNRLKALRRPTDEFDSTDFYPSSDGEPIGETGFHVNAFFLLFQALEDFFHSRRDTFLAADMFWYFERGNPKARHAPDVMVVSGVGNHMRNSYMSWLEGNQPPAIIFELTSKANWREDLGGKYKDYERLGVEEYFIFDPIDRCLRPRLQGFRLHRKTYRRIRRRTDGSLQSQLGFRVRIEGRALRLIDEATGQPILTRSEQVEVYEHKLVESLSRHVAAMSKVIEAHETGKQHRALAAEERARAERERARADRLQAELDRLRRQIGEHKRNGK